MTEAERRALLEAVAAGDVSPEEAARRLAGGPSSVWEGDSHGAADAHRDGEPAPKGAGKRIRVDASAGSVRIVGDPNVAAVDVDGEHELEEDGDTIVVRCTPFRGLHGAFPDEPGGSFRIRSGRNVNWGQFAKGLKATVRVNPDLPLEAHVSAGSLTVTGVRSPMTVAVDAGSARVHDVQAPVDVSVNAGSVAIDGRLGAGDSRITCDMGSASVRLDPRSDVRVRTHCDVGRCDVRLPAGEERGEYVLGAGSGTLVVGGSMASISVACS